MLLLAVAGCSEGGIENGDAGPEPDGYEAPRDGDGASGPDDGDIGTDVEEEDNAAFVSQEVPSGVEAGSLFEVRITMRNTGTTTWTSDTPNAHKLGSENPRDNQTWGTGRIDMDPDTTVAPGETCTFIRTLTAPSGPDTYDMQWRMVHEDVAWFGEPTGNLSLEVTGCVPSCDDRCCGADGCGGTCPDNCPTGTICNQQTCICEATGEVTKLGDGTGLPYIALAAPDRIMVVWINMADSAIYYTCFDGSDWSTPASVNGMSGQEYPRLAVDSLGRFHLARVAALGPGSEIRYSKYTAGTGCGGQWEDWTRLDTQDYTPITDYRSGWPNVDVDETNEPWVVWTEDDYNRIHTSHKTGDAWTDPEDISPAEDNPDDPVYSAHPDIAVEGSRAYVVWQDGHTGSSHPRKILFCEWDGSQWLDVQTLSQQGYYKWSQIEADENHNVYVLATDKNSPGAQLRFKPRINGVWGDWTALSTSETEVCWSSIIVDSTGRLHLVWYQQDENLTLQVFYRIKNGLTDPWQDPKQISFGSVDGVMPVIAVDDDGYAHIVWSESEDEEPGPTYYTKVRYTDL